MYDLQQKPPLLFPRPCFPPARTTSRAAEISRAFPGLLEDIIFRWLTIKGVHNYDAEHLEWGIDFLQRYQGLFPFKDIVTHRFALDEINQAIEVAHSGKAIRVAIKL